MAQEKNQVDRIVSKLGEKIKIIRVEKGWSLQDLAEKSGISAAGIHRIESNGITPTITTMMKIADALGKKVSYFIEEGEERDAVYVHGRKRESIFTFKKGLTLECISARKYGDFIMTAAYAIVEVGASSGRKQMTHRGEELVHCMQGRMEFRVKGSTYVLNPGDSIHFRTQLEHGWKNIGDIEARLIWVLAVPPS